MAACNHGQHQSWTTFVLYTFDGTNVSLSFNSSSIGQQRRRIQSFGHRIDLHFANGNLKSMCLKEILGSSLNRSVENLR